MRPECHTKRKSATEVSVCDFFLFFRCILPRYSIPLKASALSPQSKRGGMSPIRKDARPASGAHSTQSSSVRAWPQSCQERARQEAPPEIKIRYANSAECVPAESGEVPRDIFQEVSDSGGTMGI